LGGESVAGGKLKEASTAHWVSPITDATNETGFSARPGGSRGQDGIFSSIGSQGLWWGSTHYQTDQATKSIMYYNSSYLNLNNEYGQNGASIRCVKD
jgi:uncharacterized protein (TIGR02145 family)